MKILIVNDDGINALGIITLVHALKEEHELVVVAPETEQSGCAHSVTMLRPLRLKQADNPAYDGIEAYSLDGRPADCVKVAVTGLDHAHFDLILSGINRGENAGLDLLYSGTINAAMEGCIAGVPSIALSQHVGFGRENASEYAELFQSSAGVIAEILRQIDCTGPADHIYSFNFPACTSAHIRGVKACPQGFRNYEMQFDQTKDILEREFYWNIWDKLETEYNDEYSTDWKWLLDGYITVTPLSWDRTDKKALPELKCKIGGLKLHF